ncbi:MAG: hypothetical protein K2J80_07715 [Oscillospiraceae bacterium]|nr:hypothetical protein [Oscillospiraceae bacterium]
MTKQIRAYLAVLERFFTEEHTAEELEKMCAELLRRIKFYQHERLIHLIVTMSFGVFFMLAMILYLSQGGAGLLILTALFLVMLVAYIKHYYFLENSVQKMYLYYYKCGESCVSDCR